MIKRTYRLIEVKTQKTVIQSVEECATLRSRVVGLLGRVSIKPGEAVWIHPCSGIHTWGMQFAIDVLYLDRSGKLIKIANNIRPWRMPLPCMKAKSVVEMKAGEAERLRVSKGEQYRFEEIVPP